MTRAHHNLSGSRIELADAGCLYPFRADVVWPAFTGGIAARLGSATHAAAQEAGEAALATVDEEELEHVLRDATGSGSLDAGPDLEALGARWGLTPSAVAQLSELYQTWRAWWSDYLPEGAVVRYEVPFAWNVKTWTARELPSSSQRDYSALTEDEIPCTLDAVIGTPDGRIIVVDLKTGRRRHPSAATHAQLATGALCVSHALCPAQPYESVTVVLAKILPGMVYCDTAVLGSDDLDIRALRLARQLQALPTAQPVPGRHCSELYCPLLGTCEGPRAMARRAPELAAALPVTVETEEQAAAVLGMTRAAQAWLDGMKRSAVEWAERNGGAVRMPDGSVMRRTPTTRRRIDVGKVEPVLRARFGEEMGGLVKVTRSVSVTEVERAAAELGPKGRKRTDVDARRATVAAVMSEVEATGGLRVSAFSTWETEAPAAAALPKGEVL